MGVANNLISKFRRTLLVIALLLGGFYANGQAWLEQPISFDATNESLFILLSLVSEQADVGFSYNGNWPEFRTTITLTVKELSAKEVLDLIFQRTSLTYEATEDLISISRKKIIISGYLEDASSGERLVGGSVFAPKSRRGMITNSYGFYSLELPASDSLVQFSYLGYETASKALPFSGIVRLQPAGDLPEVEVIAYPEIDDNISGGSMNGERRITGRQLRRHGGLGGEASLFDLLHQSTDSQRGADGLGGLFVRGGGADQNLVLLDDVPIFQPSHAFGLFSAINPAILRSATFFQDGFPARYGGRLASVLDVRSREGNTEHTSAEIAFSSFSTKLSLEVPTFSKQGALLLAGRRTHIDPLLTSISRRRKSQEGSEGKVHYDFYDLNLKWHHTLSKNDKIYLSGYRGGDAYDNFNYTIYDLEEDGQPYDYEENLEQELVWGNTSGTLRWNHLFNDQLFANTTLTYGKYRYLSYNLLDIQESSTTDTINSFQFGRFESVIRDINLKVDVDYYQGNHHYRIGAFALARRFLPGATLDEYSEDTVRVEEILSYSEEQLNYPHFNSAEGGIYLEDQWALSPNWRLTSGLRLTAYRFEATTFLRPQPRLTLGWQQGNRFSGRISVDRMIQPLHLLTNSGANLPTDLWLPATDSFTPQDSWQVSMAGGWSPQPKWDFQFNTYYKIMRKLSRYPDEINWPGLEENPVQFLEDQLLQGDGTSYGASLKFQFITDRQTLSGGYFFNRSLREYADLNGGRTFPFSFDRPHKVVLNLEQQLTQKLRLHAHWEYTSGRPITLLQIDEVFDPLANFPTFFYEQLTDLNDFRLPAYHRLDVALEWRWKKKRPQKLRIGVYNAYNRANAYYAYDYEDPSSTAIEERQVRSLPILPSLSYSIKFGQ